MAAGWEWLEVPQSRYWDGHLSVDTTVGKVYVNANGAAVIDGKAEQISQAAKTDFEVGWIYGTYDGMFRADSGTICAEFGWSSDTDEDYIRIYRQPEYDDTLFLGTLKPVEDSEYWYTAQDSGTGAVLKIMYHGINRVNIVTMVPGAYSDDYAADSDQQLNDTCNGNYRKMNDLSHYVS